MKKKIYSNFSGMIEILPGLMNSIRMIHSISQFYNTSERMTSLFVKVIQADIKN